MPALSYNRYKKDNNREKMSHCQTYYCCLLLIDKVRAQDKTYIWLSVWWKTKTLRWWIYMSHIHWVDRGTGIPKDRDEVHRREVCECDGWVCDLDVMGVPSKLSVTRKVSDYTDKTPETEKKKRSVSRWACKNKSLTNSLFNLPDVLAITGINDSTIFLYFIRNLLDLFYQVKFICSRIKKKA
jgi:hypothetical protein